MEEKKITVNSDYMVDFFNDIAMSGQRADLLIKKGYSVDWTEYRKIIEQLMPYSLKYDKCKFCSERLKYIDQEFSL